MIAVAAAAAAASTRSGADANTERLVSRDLRRGATPRERDALTRGVVADGLEAAAAGGAIGRGEWPQRRLGWPRRRGEGRTAIVAVAAAHLRGRARRGAAAASRTAGRCWRRCETSIATALVAVAPTRHHR